MHTVKQPVVVEAADAWGEDEQDLSFGACRGPEGVRHARWYEQDVAGDERGDLLVERGRCGCLHPSVSFPHDRRARSAEQRRASRPLPRGTRWPGGTPQPWSTPAGTPVRRGPGAGTFQELLALVAAEKGVCPLAAHAATYFSHPKVAFVPFADGPPVSWALVWPTAGKAGVADSKEDGPGESARRGRSWSRPGGSIMTLQLAGRSAEIGATVRASTVR